MTGAAIAFWVLAVVTVGAALAVVFLRNIFRAALFLVLCFFGVAGLYITLQADFLAAVQVLIYVGAISVLLLFAIMLTRDTTQGNPAQRWHLIPLAMAGLVFVGLAYVILRARWVLSAHPPLNNTIDTIADALFNRFVLPFEVASVLLLAAIIGAIVLVKEK
ncbi:MAG: NADH-quinone oxidoreductase subunit J [Chloroflexota bacterium]|nr:NADH-quinone oxidoreductase subunit J [Chloroflexota bacterium]